MKNLADAYRRARKVDPKGFRSNTNIAHRGGAEARVELELMKYTRKVLGKAGLLYQLAKAAKGQPDGVVRDVIYPAVGEQTLEDICEAEAAENYEQVRIPVTQTANQQPPGRETSDYCAQELASVDYSEPDHGHDVKRSRAEHLQAPAPTVYRHGVAGKSISGVAVTMARLGNPWMSWEAGTSGEKSENSALSPRPIPYAMPQIGRAAAARASRRHRPGQPR